MDSGEIIVGTVERVYSASASTIVILHFQDGDILCTPSHPFFVIGEGWVEAGDIEIGMALALIDGSSRRVESLDLEFKAETVYSLTIEPCQTFFVDTAGVLVHNKPY